MTHQARRRGVWLAALALACLFLAVAPGAQAAGSPGLWHDQFGTSSDDHGQGVAADDSAVYVVGRTPRALPGQASLGAEDAFVRAYDPDGTEGWTRQFGTSSDDYGQAVAVAASGIYVTGLTAGTLTDQTSAGLVDAFVRKYDADGNVVWTRQFGSSGLDYGEGVAVDGSALYVVGLTSGTLPEQASAGDVDAFVRKYDLAGNVVWTRQFGTTTWDCAYGVAVDESGVYAVGTTAGAFAGETLAGVNDVFVRKYDLDGNVQWSHQFGSSDNDQGYGAATDGSGVYAAGTTYGALPGQAFAGWADAFVWKYDLDGNLEWARQFGTSGLEAAYGVAADGSGVYASGEIEGAFPGLTQVGHADVFVRRYDPDGAVVWTRQFGSTANDFGAAVGVGGSGVYTTGYTQGTLQGETSAGYNDVFVRKDNTAGDPPEGFGKVAPTDGAVGQVTSPALSWGTAAGATSYEYCLDTSNDNACDFAWVPAGTATTVGVGPLATGTVYYWQVRAVNPFDSTEADGGSWWDFTTGSPPGTFGKVTPTDGAVGQATSPALSWGTAAGATSYEYCYDTTDDGLCGPGWVSTGTTTGATPSGLGTGTTYFWQVRGVNAFGASEADGGAWWDFTTGSPPGAFGKAAPTDGAAGQPLNPTLSWAPADGATSYEYCYDPSDDGTCDGDWESAGAATSVLLTGLETDTYYWQVRAINGFGVTGADGDAWWGFATVATASFRSTGAYDGWVLESGEDTSKGSDTLNTGDATARVGDDALDRQYRAILDFDTSSLPDEAVVVGVTLRIKRESVTGWNPILTHGALKVDVKAGWYHEIQALERYDFQAVGGRGNVGKFIKVMDPGDWYRAPLRAPAYDRINRAGTTQFRLWFELDDNDNARANYLSFHTGDTLEPENRPELVVTYYLP